MFTVQYPRDAGKIFSCTFINIERGHVLVSKSEVPSEADGTFTFATTGPGYAGFTLHGGETNDSGPLPADNLGGPYSVTEVSQPGWNLASLLCVDETGNDVGKPQAGTATIDLLPGQTVSCVYENHSAGPRIIVEKAAEPYTDQEFRFQTSGPGYAPFTIGPSASHAEPGGWSASHDSGVLTAGTYTVGEVVPGGWQLASILCNGVAQDVTSGSAHITLGQDDVVVCVFDDIATGLFGVHKTVGDAPPRSGEGFTLQLRQDASPTATGTIFETRTADGTNAGNVSFNRLAPTHPARDSPAIRRPHRRPGARRPRYRPPRCLIDRRRSTGAGRQSSGSVPRRIRAR